MEGLAFVMALAVIVEGLVQYVKDTIKAISERQCKTVLTQLISLALSITLCVLTRADLFPYIGIQFAPAWIGFVLTGCVISRGANYMSDFVKRLQTGAKS